jgi:nicotinamide riboside kinase
MKKYKIGLCSTMSCGKTTLIKALSKLPQFKDYFIATERSQYLRDLGIPLNTDSTIKGQLIFGAERASELMRDLLLTDRTIIDVISFTNLAKSISLNDKENFEFLFSTLIKEYDYIFYISPEGIPIEDNGIREIDPQYRIEVDNQIKYILKKYKSYIKNYNELSGSTEERIKKLLEIINL